MVAPLEDTPPRIRLFLQHDCIGRPSSTYVWSPHDIGRESWVWEEQEALWSVDSPHKVGEEALAEWIPLCGRETERPLGKMVVVEIN